MQKQMLALLCATFILAACDGTPTGTQTAASAPATAASDIASAANTNTVAASATPAAPALSSKDGKIVINSSGQFSDKSSDASFLPPNAQAADVLLLQYDESRNLTVSAIAAGKAKTNAADLFAGLKKTIESDKTLSNVSIGEAANNRLSYAYTQAGEPEANESCIVAVAEDQSITNICASSTELSVDELKAVLADVKIGA